MPQPKEWLTIKEVAAYADVANQTVRGWIHNGSLKAFQFGQRGQIRVKVEDYERFLEESVYVPRDLRDEG